ncbi:MAG TPA: hypothetical protein VLJ38_08535, partial [Polyangiaceae bacterium]|nr:hypothetical protein [Polyangiaceae bacterium]
MLHRAAHGRACLLFLALVGAAPAAAAQDDAVRVACEALAPEDAAQVEARIRATLLTAPAVDVSVRIDCTATTANVRVVSGERSETAALLLPDDNRRDALLATVEDLLAALERENTTPPPPQASATPPAVSVPALPTPATAPPPPVAPPQPSPSARGNAPRWDIGAGALAELWEGAVGYGARLVSERRQGSWSVGADFGWLTTPEFTDVFRAHELHAFVFGALEERRTTGLRGALGAGVSVLTVLPRPDIVVRTPTTLPLVFLNAELARPV